MDHPDEQRPPVRIWPFAQAPEEYRRHDNGGDEDWVVHVPASWIRQPVARCEQYRAIEADLEFFGDLYEHRQGCDDCRDEPDLDTRRYLPLHRLAVCGINWYVLDNGDHLAITHHA